MVSFIGGGNQSTQRKPLLVLARVQTLFMTLQVINNAHAQNVKIKYNTHNVLNCLNVKSLYLLINNCIYRLI